MQKGKKKGFALGKRKQIEDVRPNTSKIPIFSIDQVD
jgi:hypothetical protein